jgi:cell division protein FtsQ
MDGGRRILRSMSTLQGVLNRGRAGQPDGAGVTFGLPVLSSGINHGRGFWRFGSRRGSFVSVPLMNRLPTYSGTTALALLFAAIGIYGALRGGQIEALRSGYGEPRDILARAAGFGIEQVTISGLAELHESEVLAAGGISPKLSLPFTDVSDIRARLEAMPLVQEAAVRKLYPNEITITLTERKPFALWQSRGEVFVVASDGTVIDRMSDERFLNLPFVVGEGANLRVKEYAALLDKAGAVRSRIRAGMLINGRRWTLKLDNGLDIRLPQEDTEQALARLEALERSSRIIAKDLIAIDLRLPDRVVVRFSEEAAAARLGTKKPVTRGGSV